MFLVIYGPTGVGKTSLVVELGRQCNGVMINADVGQFYTPLSIGTAKPDLDAIEIPYHMFNILDRPVDYSVMQFREQVAHCLQSIQRTNQLPIIVGGSGFYLGSLFFPPQAGNNMEQFSYDERTTEDLWHMLSQIDPARAGQIMPSDRYRILRAFHIWHTTGQLPSAMVPRFQPLGPFGFIVLTRDRDDLYNRINERVLHMIRHGWIDEVRSLQNTSWEDFLKKKKLLGYPEISNYVQHGQGDIQQLTALIAQKTRNYAKRQITFGKMLVKKLVQSFGDCQNSFIQIINLTSISEEKATLQIREELKKRAS